MVSGRKVTIQRASGGHAELIYCSLGGMFLERMQWSTQMWGQRDVHLTKRAESGIGEEGGWGQKRLGGAGVQCRLHARMKTYYGTKRVVEQFASPTVQSWRLPLYCLHLSIRHQFFHAGGTLPVAKTSSKRAGSYLDGPVERASQATIISKRSKEGVLLCPKAFSLKTWMHG